VALFGASHIIFLSLTSSKQVNGEPDTAALLQGFALAVYDEAR